MGATLKRSVLAGGVVYPAGTPATDELRSKIAERHWDDADSDTVDDGAGDLAALREVMAHEVTERDAKIAELEAELEQLRAATPPATADGAGTSGGAYDDLDLDALKAEIDKRNDGRDDDAKLSKRGGKDTLVAALVADDASNAGA